MMSELSYKDHYVLVTGASRGIGRIISQFFLDQGAVVIGFSRGAPSLESPNFHHISVDVGNPDSILNGFHQIKKITNVLHIVINNASVLTSQYSMIMPISAAQSMLNINLLGSFVVSREAVKLMRKNKWGRVVNISSMAARLEPIGDSVYAATKMGMSIIANVMAREFAELNITCNSIGVNAIDTDMLAQLPQDKIKEVLNSLPIKRKSNPEDITNVINFFCSKESAMITAQTIYLGGVN